MSEQDIMEKIKREEETLQLPLALQSGLLSHCHGSARRKEGCSRYYIQWSTVRFILW